MKQRTRRIHWLAVLAFAVQPAIADESISEKAADEVANEFFGTLRDVLPGKWEGEYADGSYENPTSEWQPLRVDYHLTAGDTAIIEDYVVVGGTDVYMSTVYHLDNNDIRATHYCGAMNHPRMIARSVNLDESLASFDFVDVSNLKAPEDYHSRGIDLRIVDADTVRVTFHGLEEGQTSSRVFALRRMKSD